MTMHLWGVPDRRVPLALLRMAGDRRPLRRTPGLRFAKLLGTGDGRTFTVRDADPLHWGLLATWATADGRAAFEAGPVARGWGRIATERLRLDLRPLASRGRWAGRQPFGDPVPDPVRRTGGRGHPGPDRHPPGSDVLALGAAGVGRPAAGRRAPAGGGHR